jgi:hypothetical protein
MRTSILLSVMAVTLSAIGVIGPAFALHTDLSQTAVGGNINTNDQHNTQSSSQTATATTISTNVNAPTSTIDQGGRNSFNVGVSSQNANQASSATTTQTQSNTQNAANFNANLQTFRLSQTAVCAVIASC